MSHKTQSILFCLSFLLVIPSFSMAEHGADHGPETMDLKERFAVEGIKPAVIFSHHKHQEKLNQQCIKCHVSEGGGGKLAVEFENKKGISNDFHKKFCWPCHVEMNVPNGKSCTLCHK